MSTATTTLPDKPSVARPGSHVKPVTEADLRAALHRFEDPDGGERDGSPAECVLFNRSFIRAMEETYQAGAKFRPWRVTPAGRSWLAEHAPAESPAPMVAVEAAPLPACGEGAGVGFPAWPWSRPASPP